ncbi:MAG: hypothetical protein ACOCP8_07465 [archaeon]
MYRFYDNNYYKHNFKVKEENNNIILETTKMPSKLIIGESSINIDNMIMLTVFGVIIGMGVILLIKYK